MDKKMPWPEKPEDLTKKEALLVKMLYRSGYSLRGLSEAFCELYPEAQEWPDCKGNQCHAMCLIQCASELLGEDYREWAEEVPWFSS